MSGLLVGVVATLATTILLSLVYLYLLRHGRQRHMAIWTGAWCAYSVRLVLVLMAGRLNCPLCMMASQLFSIASSAMLLWGAKALLDRRMGAGWLIATAAAGAWILGAELNSWPGGADAAFFWKNVPTYLVVGLLNIAAGAIIVRHRQLPSLARHLAGWSLIAWGLHKIDYPFFYQIEWLTPWGYLAASVLGVIVAIAMLLLHYETARRQAAQSQSRYRQLMDSLRDLVFVIDSDGMLVDVNAHACRAMDWAQEELVGRPLQQIDAAMTAARVAELAEQIDREGVVEVESAILRADGSAIPVSLRIGRIESEGQPCLLLAARDVTQRNLAQEQICRELAINAALAKLSATLINPLASLSEVANLVLESAQSLTGADHGFVSSIDPATQENVGHTLTAMMGRACGITGPDQRICFAQDSTGKYPGIWGKVLNERLAYYTNSPTGHASWGGLPAGHVPIEAFLGVPAVYGDDILGMIALANRAGGFREEDLEVVDRLSRLYALALQRIRHEQQQAALEAQLRQSQKMEAVGQLAGGVAHDFNNLLQVICGYLDLVLADLQGDHPHHELLSEARLAANRATLLTRQLLTFSRRQDLQVDHLDLRDVISAVLQMLRRVLEEHVRIVVDVPEDALPIRGDRGQIEQIVMNLCINARDAMPDGGTIRIAARPVSISGNLAGARPASRPGLYAVVEVSDTGCGIDPSCRDRIFEPFFSTKELGKGTGLGLATVYAIVERHGGFITLDSSPDRGATFRVHLPAAPALEPRAEHREPPPARHRGQETILLAEDDEMVRRLSARVLEDAGYRLVLAGDGVEAMERLGEQGGQIHLALLDVVMPGMTGKAVHRSMRSSGLDIPVVFMSGYSHTSDNEGLPPGCPLLQKPCSAANLLQTVRQTLDEHARRRPTPMNG